MSENQRVLEGAKYLTDGDVDQFGRLMRESHRSLRDLFEVSCRELDVMAEIAESLQGYCGGRMTGGGFGGCTVNLVKAADAHDVSPNKLRNDINLRSESSPTSTFVQPPMAPAPIRRLEIASL